MSKTTTTIDTYVCDFCGAESGTELARFTDNHGLLALAIRQAITSADACTACVSTKTLAELVTALAEIRKAAGYVTIKSVAGPTVQAAHHLTPKGDVRP